MVSFEEIWNFVSLADDAKLLLATKIECKVMAEYPSSLCTHKF